MAPDSAEAIRKSAEGVLELLRVGLRSMSPEADVVDYVVSGGTQSAPKPLAIPPNTIERVGANGRANNWTFPFFTPFFSPNGTDAESLDCPG